MAGAKQRPASAVLENWNADLPDLPASSTTGSFQGTRDATLITARHYCSRLGFWLLSQGARYSAMNVGIGSPDARWQSDEHQTGKADELHPAPGT